MLNLESFLNDAPKGVEVSREESRTDIIIRGTVGQAVGMIFCAVMTSIMGIFILRLAVRHCGILGGCQAAVGSSNNMFLFVAGAGMFLVSLLCWFFSVRAWKTETVIQVDLVTGNFSMFSRTPWGEGRHLDFSSETAVPVIRTRTHESDEGEFIHHQFEVYPTLRESKEGLGFFRKNPNVYVVTNWSYDKCKWAKRLIQTIQNQNAQKGNNEFV